MRDIFCQIKDKLKKQIIFETKNFYLLHDGFPLLEGHFLIIPKTHLDCYLSLSKNLQSEFRELKIKVKTFLSKFYQEPIFFEHGIAGQTVPHAHLHVLPTRKSLFNFLKKKFPLSSQQNIMAVENDLPFSYLYYEEKNKGYYFTVEKKEIVPGFLAFNFAKILNRPLKQEERIKEAPNWIIKVKKDWQKWGREK